MNHQSYHLSFQELVQYDCLTTANSKKSSHVNYMSRCTMYVNIDLKFILVIVLARMAAMDG